MDPFMSGQFCVDDFENVWQLVAACRVRISQSVYLASVNTERGSARIHASDIVLFQEVSIEPSNVVDCNRLAEALRGVGLPILLDDFTKVILGSLNLRRTDRKFELYARIGVMCLCQYGGFESNEIS